MKYLIKAIADATTGEPRQDKFYPELVDKVIDCSYGEPRVDGFLYGSVDDVYLKTSRIQSITSANDTLKVTTRNTVYVLQIMGGNE